MSTTDSPAVFDALLAEIAHNNPRGRIVVAVDGAQAASTARFADALADAARAQGKTTFRESAPGPQLYSSKDDAPQLRSVLAGFREGALEQDGASAAVPTDALLIVDGRFLLSPALRGAWHFRVWLDDDATLDQDAYEQRLRYVHDEEPRGAADAIYDVSRTDAPRRVFSDSC